MTTSVEVANRLLHFAFAAGARFTYHDLRLAVDEVEELMFATSGKHAYEDHERPAMHWKLDTVPPKQRVMKYVPVSDGSTTMVVPEKGTPLDRAIRAAVGIHLLPA